jgi:hypothetical protein
MKRRPRRKMTLPKRETTKFIKKKPHDLSYVSQSGGSIKWEVRPLPQQSTRVIAVNVKKGNWLGPSSDLVWPVKIPYIDRFGKISGCSLYSANLKLEDYISTVIATSAGRLFSWVRRHNKGKDFQYFVAKKLCQKVSSLHCITKNTYIVDRFLVLSKSLQKNLKTIVGLLASAANKLDDYKGFIYSQACSHAYWLTTRASRPRDKSRLNLHDFPLRKVGVTNHSQMISWTYNAIFTVARAIMLI